MKLLAILVIIMMSIASHAEKIVFSKSEARHWHIVNDTVMGGVSSSRFDYQAGDGVFSGNLSLENNGGFASVRRVTTPNFTNANLLRLTIKGDGRRYKFRLKTPELYQGAAYVAEFSTTADKWLTLTLTEQDFIAKYRGKIIPNAPELTFSKTVQLGFLIADNVNGKFKLQIHAIEMVEVI